MIILSDDIIVSRWRSQESCFCCQLVLLAPWLVVDLYPYLYFLLFLVFLAPKVVVGQFVCCCLLHISYFCSRIHSELNCTSRKIFGFDVSHSTFVLGYFLTHNNTRCSLQTRHFQSCNRRSRQIWQTSKAIHDLVRVYKDLAYKKRLPWLLQCHGIIKSKLIATDLNFLRLLSLTEQYRAVWLSRYQPGGMQVAIFLFHASQ